MTTGYHTTNRGRYKCDYCTQRSYKTISGITTHVTKYHELELTKDALDDSQREAARLRNQKPKVVEKERIVYREAPKKPDPKYWHHGVFCTACRIAYRSVGIPYGQTIESTPHSNCGTRSLVPVDEVVW